MLTLRRALGRWDLTAIGINQVIGGAIFLMPSQVAAEIGAWSPIAFVLMGLASLTAALTWVNVRGIRQSAWLVNALTIGKLLPLALFIVVGLRYVDGTALTTLPAVTLGQFSAAALLMIFVYGGYDVVPVPAGEAVDPRRHVPFALVLTILAVMGVMTLAQVVAQGLLPDLPAHSTPIADAAAVLLGSIGALLVGVGSVISMTGNNAGQVLSGSRMLFALAEHGELPAFFGRIHPRFRTPANAVIFTSVVAVVLALTGSFARLAVVSALARLVTYTGVSAATLRLRSPRFVEVVKPASFVAPRGPVVPTLAIVVSLAIAAGATREQLLGGLAALAAGGVLYATRSAVPVDR